MKPTKQKIIQFQSMIFDWWKKNRRDLPWRHTHNPYSIMVSEVMLQQTQVSRVLPKYKEFLTAFPTVELLAAASAADVLGKWKGMGYNRRALYLKNAAKAVTENHKGKFPESEKELLKLPGLGMYTARAIMVFAYKKQVAMVDTNIRQIITHYFFDDKPQKPSVIQLVADQLVPTGKAWEWHQALMDYGALELSKLKRPERSRRTSTRVKVIPFRQSNRFFRGRIIDLLREKSWNKAALVSHVAKTYEKDKADVSSILDGLIGDGLVQYNGSDIHL